mmetsp:Transcript_19429/g.63155  ORF Transcript_19429/g.63155 Transcript_19429/m.63155 type:complete len:149 (+) Transcript_19429:330-776(+)
MYDEDEAESWLGASPDGLLDTGGILEVKCPFNKGDPHSARPYQRAPFYYVPQVQGLLAIFDRPWADLYCWTVAGGSAIYRIERDPVYWAQLHEALSSFWYENMLPAKRAIRQGASPELYRPPPEHPLTEELKRQSHRIANNAWTRTFD